MISLNFFWYLPTIQYSIIVDQSEDNVLCNSYLNDLYVFIILKISKHCNSYCSVRCILRMPELKKLLLVFFFNNGKYLLTFIKFNRFMKKNKPNFSNWNRTKSNEEMKISSHTCMYIKIRFINQRKIKTKEVLLSHQERI